jgi:hypothetical protein
MKQPVVRPAFGVEREVEKRSTHKAQPFHAMWVARSAMEN